MPLQNASIKVTEFIIGGFESTKRPMLVGVVILITFVLTLLANILNILFIIVDKRLHKPMYLLICNLALVDILYASSSIPTMIGVLVAGVNTISYISCLVQMFTSTLGGTMEMLSLSAMAFDRLIAVSYPFQYHSYLTNVRTFVLIYILWVVACGFVAILLATLIPLPHCSSKLPYTYCEFPAIIRTTCVDLNYWVITTVTSIYFCLIFSTFIFICLSYLYMLFFVKLSSNNDKRKMGSTCLSHIIVVTGYYLPSLIRVGLARLGVVLTLEANLGLIIGNILGPTLLNPVVYCLRMKEIKSKIFNIFQKVEISQ